MTVRYVNAVTPDGQAFLLDIQREYWKPNPVPGAFVAQVRVIESSSLAPDESVYVAPSGLYHVIQFPVTPANEHSRYTGWVDLGRTPKSRTHFGVDHGVGPSKTVWHVWNRK